MRKLIERARKIAFGENRRTKMPVKEHIDLSTEVAIKLAKELDADPEIVEVASLMMDCLIGQAMQKGKIEDHIDMSLERTKELLKKTDIPNSKKENILKCVEEHHGTDRFHSLESEICCNADCYRFISIKGFTYAIRYLRDMEFSGLMEILNKKADEKWKALTLDICKKELKEQYKLIQKYLAYLRVK